MKESSPTSQYALGSTDAEHERLIRQAASLTPLTERLFREAGIATGYRVLDLGYGIIGDELTSEQIFALSARCANCRYERIAHNPDDQKYAWCRKHGMCEHFKEPHAEETDARRKKWFPNQTK